MKNALLFLVIVGFLSSNNVFGEDECGVGDNALVREVPISGCLEAGGASGNGLGGGGLASGSLMPSEWSPEMHAAFSESALNNARSSAYSNLMNKMYSTASGVAANYPIALACNGTTLFPDDYSVEITAIGNFSYVCGTPELHMDYYSVNCEIPAGVAFEYQGIVRINTTHGGR